MIGTWKMCSTDGKYYEYKITENHIIILMAPSNKPYVFAIENLNRNGFLIREFENGDEYIFNNDHLRLISKSKNQIILKSLRFDKEYQFVKANFSINKIDSSNIQAWQKITIDQYNKRAEYNNCVDSINEKDIETLDLKMLDVNDTPKFNINEK